MIFFKIIIFIFFFLVSNNVFASSLPDCEDFLEPTPKNLNSNPAPKNISRPGLNCNYYINGQKIDGKKVAAQEMPPCGKVVNPEPRINCMNLADLPSCLVFADADRKALRNCIRIGDGKNRTSPTNIEDICKPLVNGSYEDGKEEGINCVRFCYSNIADDPIGCIPRKYHHYSHFDTVGGSRDIKDRLASRSDTKLQYNCRKLTSEELDFFSDEFLSPNCSNVRKINDNGNIENKTTKSIREGSEVEIVMDYNPGVSCRYPLCDDNFMSIDSAINNIIQIPNDRTDPDDNSKYVALKNCTNDPSQSFIVADKIVCNDNNRKCYDFVPAQIEKLVSSANMLDKCLSRATDDRATANCFLVREQEKMCQIHKSLGPNCAQKCYGNDAPANPKAGVNCFYTNRCNDLPKSEGNPDPGVNCYDNTTTDGLAKPMVNCNYYDIILPNRYKSEDADFDRDIHIALYGNDTNYPNYTNGKEDNFSRYRKRFFQDKGGQNIYLPYNNLETANFAIDNNTGKFPDYFEQNICNHEDSYCLLPRAADCNYPDDAHVTKMCNARYNFAEEDLSEDYSENPNLNSENHIIAENIYNDADQDWFYKPYPLIDKGSTNNNNRQFRNIVKWNNFISWGENYNGSLFQFGPDNQSIIPRNDKGNLNSKYEVNGDNSYGRGAKSNRLCYSYGDLLELDILNRGEIIKKTLVMTGIATGISLIIGCPGLLCIPPLVVAAFITTFDRLINEFNFDKFISPKQCFAPIIHIRSNNLASSNVSGYKGGDTNAGDNDQTHYEFQYDEIIINNDLLKKYSFMDDSIYSSSKHLPENNYFKQEFLSEDDFSTDIMIKNNDGSKDLSKIILTKDAYIMGGVVTENHGSHLKYKVRACMRFDGGARSCNVSCNFLFCHKQKCGYDECTDLLIDGKKPQACSVVKMGSDGLERKTSQEFQLDGKSCAAKISEDHIFTLSSGSVRLRAVIYPDRYICVFADAKHGGQGDSAPWKVRGLVPSVSKTYKTLNNFPSTKRFWHSQYCLRYPNKIDNSSVQNMDDCANSSESQRSCEPALYAVSAEKEIIDSSINSHPSFANNNHIGMKKEFFNQFKIYMAGLNNSTTIFETDFFTPSILVRYGSELAMTSLQTGCLGNGYKDIFSDDIITGCSKPGYPVTFPNNFNNMTMDDGRNDIKISDDGLLKLKSNQYNDFTGTDYSKTIYLKKGISGKRPVLSLHEYPNYPIENIYIYRKLPNHNNILLNYDDNLGRFTIRLRDDTEIENNIAINNLRLSNVNLDITASKDLSHLPPGIELIRNNEKCFSLDTESNRANLENMKFCLKADECSILFDKCIEDNLFDLPESQRTNLWRKCFADNEKSFINKCSAKWDINNSLTNKSKMENMIKIIGKFQSNNAADRDYIKDINYYGWHHEVCLSPESYNPVEIYSHNVNNQSSDIMGKCILDPVINGNAQISGSSQSNNNFQYNAGCEEGGNEKQKDINDNPCTCLRSDDPDFQAKLDILSLTTANLIVRRNATSRELGFCFDKKLPLICQNNITEESDPYARYAARTSGTANTNYAEYGDVFLPFFQFDRGIIIKGRCLENWKVTNGANPIMSCQKSTNGDGAEFTDVIMEIDIADISINRGSTIRNISLIDSERQRLKDKNGNQLLPLSSFLFEGDEVKLKLASGGEIISTISSIAPTFIQVKFSTNSDVTVESIEINHSKNRACLRPKCQVRGNSNKPTYYINRQSNVGGQYHNLPEKTLENINLHEKGQEVGYAYWQNTDNLDDNKPREITAADIDQYVEANACLDGFKLTPGGNLPQKICTPIGEVEYRKSRENVISDCERIECNLVGNPTGSFNSYDLSNPYNVINHLQGTKFINKNLETNKLKASRSQSATFYDFAVTDLNERSVVMGGCYYDLARGLTYVSGDNTRQPYLACNYDGNESNLDNLTYGRNNSNLNALKLVNADVCELASCGGSSTSSNSVNENQAPFAYSNIVGYPDGEGSVYAMSSDQCEQISDSNGAKTFKPYPYDLELLHNVSRFDDNLNEDDIIFNDNGTRMIKAGLNPVKHCYVTNEKDSNGVYGVQWVRSDNPCISRCLGADDFRAAIGEKWDNITNANISYIPADIKNDIDPYVVITIPHECDQDGNCQNLKHNPPKKIIFNQGSSDLLLSDHILDIYFSYPDTIKTDATEETKIIINNKNSIFPSNISNIEIELVNRINTGITKHPTSFGNIEIEWQSEEFGKIQYAYGTASAGKTRYVGAGKCQSSNDCQEIEFSNPDNISFDAGRSERKFLIARKCNENGIWSKIDVDFANLSEAQKSNHQNPTNQDKATPLCAARGNIAQGLQINGSYPIKNQDIISSFKHLDTLDMLTENITPPIGLNITYPNIITSTGGYSLANRQNPDIPYTIKKCQYETSDNNIDQLSLHEYNPDSTPPSFDASINAASAKKYCPPGELKNPITDSKMSDPGELKNPIGGSKMSDENLNAIDNKISFAGAEFDYDECTNNPMHTKISKNHPKKICQNDGSWRVDGNDNCRARCDVSIAYNRGEHHQNGRVVIKGTLLHQEFFDFSFISQYKRHNHEFRGRYVCNDGSLKDESYTNHNAGEHGNVCGLHDYSYGNPGGANSGNNIDNDTYRFYNYMRPKTINYSNIHCSGSDCEWMGNRDVYNNVDCQRGVNGYHQSMP